MRKVLIADDHPLFRAAVRQAVKKALPEADIAEAGGLEEAEAILVQDQDAGLLLLDLFLPDVNGFSGLLHIKRQMPYLPVIVISACDEPSVIARAIHFGASGYIPKTLSLDEISSAINAVVDGEIWIPGHVDVNSFAEEEDQGYDFSSLTPTQLKVLIMLKNGLLNKQIAYHMSISEATVKAHITAIFRKLNVRSRTQAALAAQALDLPQEQVQLG